jgi:hypothetical protein
MHKFKIWKTGLFSMAIAIAALTIPTPGNAQGFWKKLKDQVKQAEQQAQQQQQQTQQPQQQRQMQSQQQPAQAAGATMPPDSACCTAEVMKKYAEQASFLDIVGIKLGMTPEEAFAAVKAFNPKLRIDLAKGTLMIPGEQARPNAVMRYATARTVGVRPNSITPEPFALPDGSSDVIVMVFTPPPNPPLLAKVTRHIVFPRDKPVLASKLVGALREKYGHESLGHFTWIYDANGKLLTRQLTNQESVCASARVYSGLNFRGYADSMPRPDNVTEGPALMWEQNANTRSYIPGQGDLGSLEVTPVCIPFTIVTAGDSSDNLFSPNAQSMSLTVGIDSPALLYAGYRSSQEWMQAKADSIKRKEENAVKQNSAPQL